METAAQLREQFRAIPKELRDAYQPFSIRIWRGLSWLDRAEAAPDVEGQFISLWIAFNAIYGHLEEDGWNAPDHATWQGFLADVFHFDRRDTLGDVLQAHGDEVTALIGNRYLFRPFWKGDPKADAKQAKAVEWAERNLDSANTLGLLQELFERLYVLRQQVFHGAATAHSKLNREVMATAAAVLADLIPTILAVMLNAGPEKNWGEICFPPIDEGEA